MDFGTQVRDWRVGADLTQRELARRAGIDFTYLSRIESGTVAPPTDEKILALAQALDRSDEETQYLFGLAEQARVPTDVVKSAIVRNPELGAMLRRLKGRRLSAEEAASLQNIAPQRDYPPVDEQ